MLTPEYLQSVGVDIENLFYDAETDILIDIARRIRENDFKMTATAEYQVQKLKELGLATKTINDILAEALNTSNEKIEEIMQESIYKAIRSDMYIYEAAGLDVSGISYKEQILKGTNAAKGEIKNLCKTTAQLGTNKFIELLDKAYLQASSGAFSYDMAISNVINDLAANGLGMIEYPTGTRRRIDTVARTAVRTAVNQSALKCQEDVMDEMDVNLVETSSHLGARPSHAEWQGRIFWRLKPYGNYKNFKEATGYGTGAGLGGWNCRHSFYPYFPGLSERTYQHYRKKENEEVYQLEQEQRYNERKIREWKRRQAVNKAGGVDTTLECRKVREWQQRQADFLKKHPDMKRNYAREIIEKRSITIKETTVRKNNMLLKGYEKAVNKGDISSFVTFDTYRTTAENIEKDLIGLKAKGGIIVLGYKTHFIDRIIGQYESSNEPVKGMRKGVNIQSVKNALKQGTMKTKVDKRTGKKSINYITDECIVSVNPVTKILIQTTPKK